MPKLKIQGKPVESIDNGRTRTVLKAEGLEITQRGAVEVSTVRGDGAGPQEIDSNNDSVLVLHLDGGFKLFCRHDQFREDFPSVQRDAEAGAFLIDPSLGLAASDREVGDLILKGLEVFDIRPHESVALALAAKVESQLDRKETGLFGLKLAPEFTLSDKPATPDPSKPALIFIHGTGSSTRGSYQTLSLKTPNSTVDLAVEFKQRYGDNVFALEHKSLTESPIQNALQLAEALPKNAELHLVSHSRGGMVGDLLALGQMKSGIDPAFVETLFDGRPDQAALAKLLSVLQDRQPRITRYVRVACPARGTTLASRRADRWFSMLLSLFGQLLDHFADPIIAKIYEALQDFLMAVANERTNPSVLPGIEAMLPNSPLVRLLNLPAIQSSADLSVIAGSSQGKDFLGKLKFFLPDAFYGGQHDLVVNFASMDGGVPRENGRIFPDKGPNVSHFNYFLNPVTRKAMLDGLTRVEGASDGFQKFAWKQAEIPSREVAAFAPGSRPVVFLLPGLLGSNLAVGEEKIWLDYWKLTLGGLSRVAVDAKDVKPVSVVGQFYQQITQFLESTHEVIHFPYDWRLSLQGEASRLAAEVAKRLDIAEKQSNPQPVRILAHSTGGLLTRVMLARNAGLWDRIKAHPGGRFVMLGTPNGGTYEILRVVTGQSRSVRQLSLLDLRHDTNGVLDIVGRYTGLLELLPAEFVDPDGWENLARVDGRYLDRVKDSLATAAATRKLLNDAKFDDRMLYVAGLGPDTPVSVTVASGKVTFMATSEGDGTVPWATGIPIDVNTYYSQAQHGDLANRPNDFPALLDLLENGSTARLPKQPPAVKRDFDKPYEMPPEADEVLPSERDLAAAALGASGALPFAAIKRPEQRIHVEVVHANLAFARHTVAVGHYAGDSIVGAEAALDEHLDRRLSMHNQLGVYPDRIGTAEVFLSADKTSRPSGAIVMGLGKVGDLNPKGLEQTYYNAVIRYALAAKECQDDRFQQEGSDAITTLLVGTMANVLTIEECLLAMLRAVRSANAALDRAEPESSERSSFRIRSVEVMELWEDRAIQTADALARMCQTPELKDILDPVLQVNVRDGGLRRYASTDDEGWWSRLRVTQDSDQSPLKFALFTNRARTEIEEVQEPQRASALIKSAIASPAIDLKVSQALFEMLVPNRLKEYAPELTSLVLMVDQISAAYPWELFHDRLERRDRPLAVDSGMVRQLDVGEYRPMPLQSDEQTALVVGNPITTKYPALPGAETEGRQVVAALEGARITVTQHIHTTGAAIRRDLYSGSYRILHLAGHGVQQFKTDAMPKAVNGMVIGDDDFLTPSEIGQLRPVPELVFINCCHLGRTDVLAANLAVEFTRIGVRAVIAAGWAVDDKAASTFATQFYKSFLGGDAFGDAVRVARAVTYQQHGNVNTWGAYQCYGDPGYRFRKAGSTGGGSTQSRIGLPSQLALELDNLSRRSRAVRGNDRSNIEGDLKELIGRKDLESWWKRPNVLASLGNLYAELGDYQNALKQYDLISQAATSTDVPLQIIEQEANLRARAAARGRADGSIDQIVFLEQIDAAVEKIEIALKLGRTSERLRIKASAYKRRATWAEDPDDRRQSLERMTEAYKASADRLGTALNEYSDPKVNWLVGCIILSWFGVPLSADYELEKKALQPTIERGKKLAAADPSFWNAVVEPDGRLVLYLAIPEPEEAEAEAIAHLYRKAKCQGGSPREVASIVEHLHFIAVVARHAGKSSIADSMDRVVRFLESDGGMW